MISGGGQGSSLVTLLSLPAEKPRILLLAPEKLNNGVESKNEVKLQHSEEFFSNASPKIRKVSIFF